MKRRDFLKGLKVAGMGIFLGTTFSHLVERCSSTMESSNSGKNISPEVYFRSSPLYEDAHKRQRSIQALENAINQPNNLSQGSSRKNLETNLVNFLIGKFEGQSQKISSLGNGLRITYDGFVLTAYHVIKEMIDGFKSEKNGALLPYVEVIDQTGRTSLVDPSFAAIYQKYDLALVKLKSIGPSEAIPFNIKEGNYFIKEPIESKAWFLKGEGFAGTKGQAIDQKDLIIPQRGVLKEVTPSQPLLITTAGSFPGMSGGIYLDAENSFAGIINASSGKSIYKSPSGKHYSRFSYGATINDIKRFVLYTANQLKSRENRHFRII